MEPKQYRRLLVQIQLVRSLMDDVRAQIMNARYCSEYDDIQPVMKPTQAVTLDKYIVAFNDILQYLNYPEKIQTAQQVTHIEHLLKEHQERSRQLTDQIMLEIDPAWIPF